MTPSQTKLSPPDAPKSNVRNIVVREGESGQRIDNYLLSVLKGVPKSRIYKLLRTGEVRVNKGRVKPPYRLQTDDVVRIPPVRMAEQDAPQRIPAKRLDELRAAVILEDDDLLVLNKPSGWAVHGGSGVPYGVIEAIREMRPDLPDVELVHRLDRETSGCLVLAKNRKSLTALHEMLRSGGVDKRYFALVMGKWPAHIKKVDVALQKNRLASGERMVRGADEGKESLTEFKIRSGFGAATLLEVRLLTGRTHQIRVHAAHVGHPVAGDDKYGDSDFNKHMKRMGLKRLFLHAYSMRFKLPHRTGVVDLHAPLPDDLQAVVEQLGS